MPFSVFKQKIIEPNSKPSFNLVPEVNSFNNIFGITSLEQQDENNIEKLLIDGFQPGNIDESRVGDDVESLKKLTAEIKAIGKQCVVLLGERVYKARKILKPYRDGTFTKWLESAFGTRKSGYNALGYYELHNSLPEDDLRDKLAKLQKNVAYTLASRDGDIEKKAEIIRNYYNRPKAEIENAIKETFPVGQDDKRSSKVSINKILKSICHGIEVIRKNRKDLTQEDLLLLVKAIKGLNSLNI